MRRASRLWVHRRCGRIGGRISVADVDAGRTPDRCVGLVQRCGCGYPAEPGPDWSGFDFDTAVELCHCCAAVTIPTGSRWSPYFCRRCLGIATELDRSLGRIAVPIGRHSLMHCNLVPDLGPDPGIGSLVTFLVSPRHGLLSEWRHLRVERILEDRGGTRERFPLDRYLDVARVVPLDLDSLVREMATWLDLWAVAGEGPDTARPDPGSDPEMS